MWSTLRSQFGDQRSEHTVPLGTCSPPSVVKSGKTATECLRNSSELPLQCQHLLSSYADCKRGLVSCLEGSGVWCGRGSAERRKTSSELRGKHTPDESSRSCTILSSSSPGQGRAPTLNLSHLHGPSYTVLDVALSANTDSQLDMRRRFRGNHLSDDAKKGIPAHAPKELNAER